MRKIFRDPFSGFSHIFGALLGVAGLIYLMRRCLAIGDLASSMPFLIFGVSVILMYSSSGIYHLTHASEATIKLLRRIDHTMIFILIAGSYTPFCLVALKDSYGLQLMAAIWGIAFAGFAIKLFWMHAPRWLSTGLYLCMGWLALLVLSPLSRTLTSEGLAWLFAGGLLYSVGAVIYAVKRPDPFPPHFGFHEIWHLFVLAGTTCHFFSVVTLL
jgi:hemolysin III